MAYSILTKFTSCTRILYPKKMVLLMIHPRYYAPEQDVLILYTFTYLLYEKIKRYMTRFFDCIGLYPIRLGILIVEPSIPITPQYESSLYHAKTQAFQDTR